MLERLRAAALFLGLTLVVAAIIAVPILFLWYPGALFSAAGGRELFFLIVGVDLVLGPTVIFVIYRPGKKGLFFDLLVLGIVQFSALCFGIWVLFESRPAYIVFVKDRFELVRANEIPPEELAKAKAGPFAKAPIAGPTVVGAELPKDPDEQFRIMMSAMSGVDVQNFPQYYVPYDDVRGYVLLTAKPIARLRELNPGRAADIDRIVRNHGGAEDGLRFLPMRAGKSTDLTVVLDKVRGDVLEISALRPWEFK
jgi:hypothetical protein